MDEEEQKSTESRFLLTTKEQIAIKRDDYNLTVIVTLNELLCNPFTVNLSEEIKLAASIKLTEFIDRL